MKKNLKHGVMAAETFLMSAMSSLVAYADDEIDLEWITEDSNGTFDEAISSFQGIFASGYSLMIALGSGIIVLCLIFAGIMLAAGSARNKDEAKSKVLWVIVGGIIIFAAVSITSLIAGIAQGAFGG